MSAPALEESVKRPKAPRYRWLNPYPRRWGHALATNMVWAEIRSHFRPLNEYESAAWNGEIGRYENFNYYDGSVKPRIYPGKRWARP